VFLTKKIVSKLSEIQYDLDLDFFYPSRIQGSKKAPDPGSATPDIWTCCCAADSTTPLSVVVRKATVKKTGSSSQLCYRMEAKPRYLPTRT
jgi:hypothetical protein